MKKNNFMLKLSSFHWFCLFLLLSACNNNGPARKTTNRQTDSIAGSRVDRKVKTIVFFGNSLTAGYGLDDPSDAYPSLIQARIDSLNLPFKVINAGLSGETSAGGNSRIDWVLQQPINIFVLELGGNDGLRGISPSETAINLQAIIDKVRQKYPAVKIILAGMKIPPSMGDSYATKFSDIYPNLAKRNKIALIPFLLEGVGGEPQLNQRDEIHPTAEGHRIIAENVWKVLKPFLQ